jgi:hypothetical protein
MVGVVRPRERFRLSVYDPISFVSIPDYPHDIPASKYYKHLPLFPGKFGVLVEDHLANFLKVVDDCDMEYEDICANP